jgi:hypothetical protein
MEKVEEVVSDCAKYSSGQPLTFTQALALRNSLGRVLTHTLLGRTLPFSLSVTVPGIGPLSLTIGVAQPEAPHSTQERS